MAAETWQEEMARWEGDPEFRRQRNQEARDVAQMLRDHGVDLPIVAPNPHYPVGEQIGQEARFKKDE